MLVVTTWFRAVNGYKTDVGYHFRPSATRSWPRIDCSRCPFHPRGQDRHLSSRDLHPTSLASGDGADDPRQTPRGRILIATRHTRWTGPGVPTRGMTDDRLKRALGHFGVFSERNDSFEAGTGGRGCRPSSSAKLALIFPRRLSNSRSLGDIIGGRDRRVFLGDHERGLPNVDVLRRLS